MEKMEMISFGTFITLLVKLFWVGFNKSNVSNKLQFIIWRKKWLLSEYAKIIFQILEQKIR